MLGISATSEMPICSLGAAKIYVISVADSLALSEVHVKAVEFTRYISDFIEFTDRSNRVFDMSVGDTLVFSQTPNSPAFPQTLNDNLIFTDFGVGLTTRTIGLFESMTFFDKAFRTANQNTIDRITFLDSVTAEYNKVYQLGEILRFTEQLSARMDPNLYLFETLIFTEVVDVKVNRILQEQDFLTFTESLDYFLISLEKDTLSWAESVTFTVVPVQKAFDILTFTESIYINSDTNLTLTDQLVFSEHTVAKVFPQVNTNDFLALAETVIVNMIYSLGVCDCLSFNESIGKVYDVSVEDEITFSDESNFLNLADVIIFEELVEHNGIVSCCGLYTYVPDKSLFDSLVFSESVFVGKTLNILVEDLLEFQDSIMRIDL